SKHIKCTPPHDVPLKPWRPLLVQPDTEAEAKDSNKTKLTATETAELINTLIIKSQTILASHPLNIQRMAEGKDPANSIWPWAGGYRPHMTPLTTTFPQIKKGAVITAVDLIRGIGSLAGLRVINVEGATGLYDTNYEGKAQAAIEALRTDDFVYLHIEASDEAGHDGDLNLKLQTIENLDSRAIAKIYEEVKNWGVPGTPTADMEPVSIAVLPDHPTPVAHRTHTNEPVPFLIYAPGITPDSVQTFDEDACQQGSFGLLEKDGFIKALMKF
ncbi:MAG: phosphoglycerate mutase, partial [Bacteroidales bacterium]|nr:phosphoglycerate mutase [Bacteroidales bacterium]